MYQLIVDKHAHITVTLLTKIFYLLSIEYTNDQVEDMLLKSTIYEDEAYITVIYNNGVINKFKKVITLEYIER